MCILVRPLQLQCAEGVGAGAASWQELDYYSDPDEEYSHPNLKALW